MITVACVFVRANVPFTLEYVENLQAMVAKHLPREHRFVCLTDRAETVATKLSIDTISIPNPRPLAGWWSKLELFNQVHHLEGRVLYLDLDTLVMSSLEPVIDFPARFALVPDSGSFYGQGNRQVVKRFNSSVMVWDAGVGSALYQQWSARVADRLWGDQDWIGEQYPDAAVMPIDWFPRISALNGQPPARTAKVVLVKKPKNNVAADLYPWVAKAWRAA